MSRHDYTRAPRQEVQDSEDEQPFGLNLICCEPAGVSTSTAWRHVGQGQGGYDKMDTYKYVGKGAGSWNKELVKSRFCCGSQGWSWCLCFFFVSIALVAACTYLWQESLLPVLRGYLSGGAHGSTNITGSLMVTGVDYNSFVNVSGLRDELGRAIASEAGPPVQPDSVVVNLAPGSENVTFTIAAVPENSVEAVVARLRRHQQVESSIGSQLATVDGVQAISMGVIGVRGFHLSSDASPSAAASAYDCDADYTECYDCLLKSWSASKLIWCCQNRGRGCSTTTTLPDYDCLEGYENWKLGWSIVKKAFCCAHEDKGCEEGASPPDEANATRRIRELGPDGLPIETS